MRRRTFAVRAALGCTLSALSAHSEPDVSASTRSPALQPTPTRELEERQLSGTYAYVLETVTTTRLPVIKDYVATTRSVALVTLNFQDQHLRGEGAVCDVRIRGSSPIVATELPEAFRLALPKVRFDAKVAPQAATLAFKQAPQTLVLGAKLRDPQKDALPEDPDDPRVLDSDRDGNPGVTVQVRGLVTGRVFVVQRSTSSLEGRATPSGFAGRVQFRVEQRTLGATSPFLRGGKPGIPNPEKSYFVLEKLPRGASCREAVARALTIQSPRE